MKAHLRSVSVLFLALFSLNALANDAYPIAPNAQLTPGSLCEHADQIRYPERIIYCERDVDTQEKRAIIREYDQKLGFRIQSMNRQDFKIDHYIPLCAGGSNNRNNLWPQHQSVFKITDKLEQVVCEQMAQGHLRQRDAVDLIREGKNDLSKVEGIIERLQQQR